MTDRIDPGVVGGVSSAEALAGAERMAEALRAAGWRVEPPTQQQAPPFVGNAGSEALRERVCQWVRDNGLNPNDIPIDADIVVGKGTITTDVVVRGEDGKPMIDGNRVLRRRVTVPLLKPWGEDASASA